MKIHLPKVSGVLALLALLLTLNFDLSTAFAQGTGFMYEGQLQNSGSPANGTYNFQFQLYTNDSGGTPVAGPFTNNGVPVANGLFTVMIDFGSAVWDGHTNWLEVAVETNGASSFATLAPRQQMTPTPYAIFATTASNLVGTLPVAQLTGTVGNSQLANNAITINTGAGLSPGSTVALGGSITLNNTGVTSLTGGDGVTVSGTGNLTLGLGNTLTLTGNLPVTIGTGSGSLLGADINGNFFVGLDAGNTSGSDNTAVGSYALQSNAGGAANTAEGAFALLSNTTGSGNTANGGNSLLANEGGSYNTAEGAGALQSNDNGIGNTASGFYSLVSNGGGSYNTALGYNTLLDLGVSQGPGGSNNIAIGFQAGSAFTGNESSNIDIGNAGVLGENNTIRIGDKQTAAYIAGIITGDGSGLVNLNASQITGGTINNSQLANSSITVNAGPGLSVNPGSMVALGGTITLNNTGVTSLTGGDGLIVSGTGDLTLGLGNTLTLTGTWPFGINTGIGSLLYADNNQNYFAGIGAGNQATTGLGNTATGVNALASNTTGSDNTANGLDALPQNTTGTGNTANGAYALAGNASGSDNTAVGMYVLVYNETGIGNTASGVGALQFGQGSSYNTALGDGALGPLGTTTPGKGGTNNIAIGFAAGTAFNGIESSNIDIGNVGVLGENNITRIGQPGIQTAAYIAGIINGDGSGLTTLNASQITVGTINNSQLANNSITVNTGGGVTGGGTVALGGTVSLGATSSDTANAIVSRDSSGNFNAGSINLFNSLTFVTNIAIGNGTLIDNTVGRGNIAIGELALPHSQTGSNNIAIGNETLLVVQFGNTNNIAIGNEALEVSQENNQLAIGNQSLASVEFGLYDTAVGQQALELTQNGIYSTAVGYQAMQNIYNVNGDTAVGYQALQGGATEVFNGGSGNNGNTAVGYLALQETAFAIENTGVGAAALHANTNGNSNTAFGYAALSNATNGNNDIALGYLAGTDLTTGDNNIDIGNTGTDGDSGIIRIGTPGVQTAAYLAASVLNLSAAPITINSGASSLFLADGNTNEFDGLAAGNSTTTGYFNTGVGPAVLGVDTTGYQNTAVGYQTLYQNTEGYNNCAFGDQALYFNTEGAANTATGVIAMYNNTTGTANTADGQQALYSNQSAGDNTAVGFQSLYSSTSTGNTAVGRSALTGVSSGSDNIGVGDYAGQYLTTGNNNIDIGNTGSSSDDSIIRIGTPGIQTDTYLAGLCKSEKGYCCLAGINGSSFGNTFNFFWTGSQLQAWVDYTEIGIVQVTSDRRLKENIEPMTDDALSRVMTLKPSSFKYKNIPGTVFHGDGTQEEGFIADELQQVIPSAVNGQKDARTSKGDIQPQTVNLMPVVAVLTKAMQEQQQRIDAQQLEINDLKAMVKTLSTQKVASLQ